MTVNNYLNYQLYDNGWVWYKTRGVWKKSSKGERGHLHIRLTNQNGSKTFLIHRLVYEHFIGHIPNGYVTHHVDHNPQNNNWTNLTLLKRDEHTREHKIGNKFCVNRHPSEKTKQKISNKLKQYMKKHPLSQQQRKLRSQNMKRVWAQRRLERGG